MNDPITDDDIAGARTLVPAECVGLLRIVDGMREMIYAYRRILAAAPDFLPLARVAELHADALTMGGCAEVNECDLAALTAEVLQARAARPNEDDIKELRRLREYLDTGYRAQFGAVVDKIITTLKEQP